MKRVRPMRRRVVWLLLIAAALAAGFHAWSHRFGVPEDFADMEAEYKYGSIGSDHPLALAPIPYWIWKVLPELYPPAEFVPAEAGPGNGKKGFAAFGLVTEAAMERPLGHTEGQTVFDRPIGFSKRTTFGIDFVGVNCAFCHLTSIRSSPQDAPQIVLGGTGNTVNIQQYFLYMFATMGVDNKRFNAEEVMGAITKAAREQGKELGFIERLAYRFVAIPLIPRILAARQREYFDFITIGHPNRLPNFGPGRVDTWAAYKRLYVDPPQRDRVNGIVDFPSIWNAKARTGVPMHWDGNTDVFEERNIVSALAVIGTRLHYLDARHLKRIGEFLNGLLPPRYEDRIPEKFRVGNMRIRPDLAERGKSIFRNRCASCHAPDGDRIGRVEPNEDLGTDGERLRDFTPELAAALNRLGTDAWKLRSFKRHNGYVNTLLDGIWLRAPYLHNGSVPTLRDLLNEPGSRPKQFCRGTDLFDWKDVGFVSAVPAGRDCGEFFLFDTSVAGNGNGGHQYGVDLEQNDKEALLEFLKTL